MSPIKQNPLDEESEYPDPRDLDFLAFKAQQKEFLKRKLAAQSKLESLHREYNFISKLSPDELVYIMERKKHQAATQIQRTFRRKVLSKKQQLKEDMRKALDGEMTAEEMQVVEGRKRELGRLREKVASKYGQEEFYREVGEERKKELREEVLRRKRLQNQTEMEKKALEVIEDRFNQEYGQFMSTYLHHERNRVQSL